MMMIKTQNKKQIFKYNFNCRSSDQDVRWKKTIQIQFKMKELCQKIIIIAAAKSFSNSTMHHEITEKKLSSWKKFTREEVMGYHLPVLDLRMISFERLLRWMTLTYNDIEFKLALLTSLNFLHVCINIREKKLKCKVNFEQLFSFLFRMLMMNEYFTTKQQNFTIKIVIFALCIFLWIVLLFFLLRNAFLKFVRGFSSHYFIIHNNNYKKRKYIQKNFLNELRTPWTIV
jgi:hypothetical protein